jgi:flavorubredoxin
VEVAVVYESLFGNTREIAEAIAEGVQASAPDAHVAVVPVAEAGPDKLSGVDLLVVGGPTHIRRMSSARTRKDVATGPGIREWLEALPSGPARGRAAAFDTRLSYPLAGSAARPISRALESHGYEIVAPPAGFIVREGKGPLKEGERERARTWGTSLVLRSPR